MRISDWSSDVCSSDLAAGGGETLGLDGQQGVFVVAGEEGGDLDDFAYQFAHKTGLLAKMGGTLLPAPPASLTGACDRLMRYFFSKAAVISSSTSSPTQIGRAQ